MVAHFRVVAWALNDNQTVGHFWALPRVLNDGQTVSDLLAVGRLQMAAVLQMAG